MPPQTAFVEQVEDDIEQGIFVLSSPQCPLCLDIGLLCPDTLPPLDCPTMRVDSG